MADLLSLFRVICWWVLLAFIVHFDPCFCLDWRASHPAFCCGVKCQDLVVVMGVFIPYHRDGLSDNGLYSGVGLNGGVALVLWIVPLYPGEDALHRVPRVVLVCAGAFLLDICLGLLKGVKHLGT